MERLELVVFTAPWCGPCRMMQPLYNELEAQGLKITKINVDEQRAFAAENQVGGVPTMIFRKDGIDRIRVVGAHDRQYMFGRVQQLLDNE